MLLELTAFASLFGVLFIPALNITAFATAGPEFIKVELPTSKKDSFICFNESSLKMM